VFGPWMVDHGLDGPKRFVVFCMSYDRPFVGIRVAPYRPLAPTIMHRIGLMFRKLSVFRVKRGQEIFPSPAHIATKFFRRSVLDFSSQVFFNDRLQLVSVVLVLTGG